MKQKGKGRGRKGRRPGRHLAHLIDEMTTAEYEETFFGGIGKGKEEDTEQERGRLEKVGDDEVTLLEKMGHR